MSIRRYVVGSVVVAQIADPREMGAKCDECPLYGARTKPVWPTVRHGARLAIVGEGPGANEERVGRPFVGESGKLLDELMTKAGGKLADSHITNATLCRPRKTLTPAQWHTAVECCRPRLIREIATYKLSTLLLLGSKALESITGKAEITRWAGAPQHVPLKKVKIGRAAAKMVGRVWVLPTYHPAYILRRKSYYAVLAIHIAAALKLARRELKWRGPRSVIRPGRAMIESLRAMRREMDDIGVDIETQGIDPLTAKIMCIGVANKKRAVSVPWAAYDAGPFGQERGIDEYKDGAQIKGLLLGLLACSVPKILQNGTYDILGLGAGGIAVGRYAFDTLLAHALVAPQLEHTLGFIASLEHMGATAWKADFRVTGDQKGADNYVKRDPKLLRAYNAEDAWRTRLLKEPLEARLKRDVPNGPKLMYNHMCMVREVTMPMKRCGVHVDLNACRVWQDQLVVNATNERSAMDAIAQAHGMTHFNPNSQKHRNALFFDHLKAPKVKRSKTTGGASLDEEVLTTYQRGGNGEVTALATHMLAWRRANKLLDYVHLKVDVVHPNWKPEGALTGRFASSEPNMQNVPAQMRNVFVPREGMWWVSADYSQLEVRILALLAGDQPLLDLFATGRHIHTETAKALFNLENPNKDQKTLAKGFLFGSNYGGSVDTIHQKLLAQFPNLPRGLVEKMQKAWFKAHPAIEAYQSKVVTDGMQNQYVDIPVSGKRIYFQGAAKPTEILNYPIQGMAAAVVNQAMLRVARCVDWKTSNILCQVHDQIDIECTDWQAGAKMLKECMTTHLDLGGFGVDFSVEVKYGRNWRDLQGADDGG